MHNYLKYFKTLFFILFLVPGMSYANLTGKKWAQVSSGYKHSLALDFEGNVWVWGVNASAQLGLGDNAEVRYDEPVKLDIEKVISQDHKEIVRFKRVIAGPSSSFGISFDDELWAWGSNVNGILGLNTTSSSISTPTLVESFTNLSGESESGFYIKSIQNSSAGSVALSTNGKVYVWGDNKDGAIYPQNSSSVLIQPTQIQLFEDAKIWQKIDIGQGERYPYVLALASDGQLFSWGDNFRASTGTGSLETLVTSPSLVNHPDGKEWKHIETISFQPLAVDVDGYILSWANGNRTPNYLHTDGNGEVNWQPYTQAQVTQSQLEQKISTSYQQLGVLDGSGRVFLWGVNESLNISPDKRADRINDPTEFKLIPTTTGAIEAITLGQTFTFLHDEDKELLGFGSNINGELGFQTTNYRGTSLKLASGSVIPAQGFGFSNPSASFDNQVMKGHSLAIRIKGYCFKDQPELETDASESTFNPAGDNETFCANYNADDLTQKVTETYTYGELWGWGDNTYNQLGSKLIDPDKKNATDQVIEYPTPLLIKKDQHDSLKNKYWRFATSSGANSYAIDVEGNLFSWGRNNHGQLGLGGVHQDAVENGIMVTIPTQVGSHKYKTVSASSLHALAISQNGKKLYAWGNNSLYKLGTGDLTHINNPTEIGQDILLGEDEVWKTVAASENFSTAITSKGRRFVWGTQKNGYLGNGQSEGYIKKPTLVVEALVWEKISVSNTYSIGVADNKIYIWGENIEQNLEADPEVILTEPHRTTPGLFPADADINTVASFLSINSSNNAHFAIDIDNQTWGWGGGAQGWLGDGTESEEQILPAKTAIGLNLNELISSGRHTIGTTKSEHLVAWGDNSTGQLGLYISSGKSYTATPGELIVEDKDGDGIPDNIDSNPEDYNITIDSDADGVADENDKDSDNDGLEDWDEVRRGLDPFNANDILEDKDKDGISLKDELVVYGTCDADVNTDINTGYPIDPICVNTPNPLELEYIQHHIFKDKNTNNFENNKMNRLYLSFESSDYANGFGWVKDTETLACDISAKQEGRYSRKCFEQEVKYYGFISNTPTNNEGVFTYFDDEANLYSLTQDGEGAAYQGEHSLKLSVDNKAFALNPVFGPKRSTYRNWLKTGKIHFAYKVSAATAKLRLVSYNSNGAATILWPKNSTQVSNSTEWMIVDVMLEEDTQDQLTWELISTGDEKASLDTISIPINMNEKWNGSALAPTMLHTVYSKLVTGGADSDNDNDKLTNLNEYVLGTNPNASDTDKDGLDDYKEFLSIANNGTATDPLNDDTDNDDISDGREFFGNYKQGIIIKTDPLNPDSDNDGLSDKEEQDGATISVDSVNVIVLSDPTEIHSDTDGISDNEELCLTVDAEEIPNCIKTNPSANDTDGDGIDDEVEIDGFNIVVNGIEIHVTSNPTLKDSNNDGLEDGFKKLNNLDPNLDDTDGDGLSDFNELNTYKTDPSMSDSDEDGIADNIELCLDATTGEGIPGCVTSNPINSDSDGDGIIDGKDNNIEVSTRYVYLDNNKNGAIEVPFVETSVAYGRQILSLVDVKTGKKAEVNGVVQEFHIPSWFTADSAKIVRNSNKDTNPNTPETNDVVLAGNTSDGKRAWVIIDGDSGKLFQSLAFPSWFTPLKMQVVPDVTGNFKDEILMFGSTSDNKRVWMSHDTGTRIEVSRAVYPSWFIPSELVIVPESTDLAIKKYDVFTYGVKTDNNYAHFVNSIKPSTQKAALNQANEVKGSTSVNRVDEQGNLGIVLHEVMSDNIHQITTKLARGYTAVNGNVPSINAVKLASGWQFEQIASFDDTSNEAALSKFATIESRDLASKQLTIRNSDLSVLKVVQLQNTSSYDNSFDFSEGYDWKILSNLNLQSMVNIPDFDDDEVDDILISGTSLVNEEEVNILIVYSSSATQKPLKLHNMHNLKSLH